MSREASADAITAGAVVPSANLTRTSLPPWTT